MRVTGRLRLFTPFRQPFLPSVLNCHREANKEDSKRNSAVVTVIIQVSPLASLNNLELASPMDILPQLTQTVCVQLDHWHTF